MIKKNLIVVSILLSLAVVSTTAIAQNNVALDTVVVYQKESEIIYLEKNLQSASFNPAYATLNKKRSIDEILTHVEIIKNKNNELLATDLVLSFNELLTKPLPIVIIIKNDFHVLLTPKNNRIE